MGWNPRKYDAQHNLNTATYVRRIKRAFNAAIERIVNATGIYPINQAVPFNINDYPGLKKIIDLEIKSLSKQINTTIINGINREWDLANSKNDMMLKKAGGSKAADALIAAYSDRNLKALSAFTKRTEAGMKISERVWNLSKGFQVDIERALAVGISRGSSAQSLARDIKQYLVNPDMLFRRVRDAEGELRLSRNAKDFHPGQGVYRSSYKNAMRLARTETNKAYHKADNERWQKMDFILGIEVRRSSVRYDCDECDSLAGRYPPDFEFESWHPNCMCHARPILPTEDDFIKSMEAELEGKEYEFKGYINKLPNTEEYEKWRSKQK